MTTLSTELLSVLTAGDDDDVRLRELLSSEGHSQTNGHVAIEVNGPPRPPSPPRVQSNCLLGVASNDNTALHLVASRGNAKLAELICEHEPCLVTKRNKGLDTPLHCAAKAGSTGVADRLLSTMRDGGTAGAMALLARNCMGATALHEAVRWGHGDVVKVLMDMAPELASERTEDGVSALYMAAVEESEQIVRLLLRPLPAGAPPASFAGRMGRTALHAAAAVNKDMAQQILKWKPDGPTMLKMVDSSGRTPLQVAIQHQKFEVVELFLDDVHTSDELLRIPDNHGLFPVHTAAMGKSTRIIDALVKKCPDYHEMAKKDDGMNILHVAVVEGNDTMVSYICQTDRFNILWNATDFQGNTPLHLAVKCGHARIVSTLLQMASVEINTKNKDGRTARDLAYIAYNSSSSRYFLDPSNIVIFCLRCAGAKSSFDAIAAHKKDETNWSSKEDESVVGYIKGRSIASTLIATVTFAAAITVPGGFISDGHTDRGKAILARRFAFRAFTVSNTVAFLYSILATCYFIYGEAREVPARHRRLYNISASRLLPIAFQFMIAAFAFGFHLALGGANRGLIIFVYFLSSASVLFCFPGIWVPFSIGYIKVLWRRRRWIGLIMVPVRRVLFAVLICATFIVAIVLEIALPNY